MQDDSLGVHRVNGLLLEQVVEDEHMWHHIMEQIQNEAQISSLSRLKFPSLSLSSLIKLI